MFQDSSSHSYQIIPRNGKRIFYSAPQKQDNISTSVFNEYLPPIQKLDFATEERQRRQEDLKKRQQLFEKKRETKILQEAGRRQAIEAEYKKDLEKLELRKAYWKPGQKNYASEAYNMITLDYDPNSQGAQLKFKDDQKRFREDLRMNHLDSKMNSGYNIITGAARPAPRVLRYFN
jgi:hypothetical protein